MKKIIVWILALAMMFSLLACASTEQPQEPSAQPEETVTAEEEQVQEGPVIEEPKESEEESKEEEAPAEPIAETEYWGVMVYALTPDGIYSRSDVFSFDPETKVAEISWILGKDNGIVQAYEGAEMGSLGVEIWNFSIGADDYLSYSIDEMRYVTADGEVVLDEALGERETDMSDGTGGGTVAELKDVLFADVLEVHAKVTFKEAHGPLVEEIYGASAAAQNTEEQPASETDGWGVMAYFTTPDGAYSRSDIFYFDPDTKTAEITWKLGQDNGVLDVKDDSVIDILGIELWNFSLGEKDILAYRVDEMKYVTMDGEVVVADAVGDYQTDMSGGTGGGTVADIDNPAVSSVTEIHAKVTYVEKTGG